MKTFSRVTGFTLLIIVTGFTGYFIGRHGHPGDSKQAVNVETPADTDKPLATTIWTCSMHPQIRLPKSGKCPICGMTLIPAGGIDGNHAGSRAVVLSPLAEKLAEVELAPVQKKHIPYRLRLVGKIAYDQTRLRSLSLLTDALIDKLYVNYLGVRVKQGQPLADLYSPEVLAAAKELIVARNAVRSATDPSMVNAARQKLVLLGVGDREIEDVFQTGKVGKTFTVFSPIDGILRELGGYQGQWLNRGERLGEIAVVSTVWAFLDAYESDIEFIRYGQPVEFLVEAFPGRTFQGIVAFIAPELDDLTRTIKIRLNIPNPDEALRPGMFVRAVVKVTLAADNRIVLPDVAGKWICPIHPEIVSDREGTCDLCRTPLVTAESLGFVSEADTDAPLVIPVTAPLITGDRAVVYVLDNRTQGGYEGREIQLGNRVGDYYIVRSGLSEGEKVVVRGTVKVDSTLQILAKPSMMSRDSSPDVIDEGQRAKGEDKKEQNHEGSHH